MDWTATAEADPLGWWRVLILRNGTTLAVEGKGRGSRWKVFEPGTDLYIMLSGEVMCLGVPGHRPAAEQHLQQRLVEVMAENDAHDHHKHRVGQRAHF